MTTMPTMPLLSLKPCQILGTSVEPTREQIRELLELLFALLEFGVNMASRMPDRRQYAQNGSVPNGSVVTVEDLMSLFNAVYEPLLLIYRRNQVCDTCASAIVNALWALAHTLDTLVQVSLSSSYRPHQAVGAVREALCCVQPKEEDSDGEESDDKESPLRRDPALPPNYLVDVQTALTAIQKHGQ